jgi:RNA polymerase sigma-70 factor, ECF subfamily
MINQTDNELFDEIKKNDASALKILYEKYFESLCYFSVQFVKSADLAEEVVSDVYTNIWLKRKNIEIKTSIKSYLFSAVRNQSLNYIKSEERLSGLFEKDSLHLVVNNSLPDEEVLAQELKSKLEAIIEELPEKRGIIFKMNRIDGLSYSEIAEILSISVSTVQNQMIKAIKYMSDQLPRIKKLFSILF